MVRNDNVQREVLNTFLSNTHSLLSIYRSGWNLNVLPHLPSSVLRHFGSTPGKVAAAHYNSCVGAELATVYS